MLQVDFSHLRFLVVDDNAHMRRIIRNLLGAVRVAEIYEASDGAEALDIFSLRSPDVILLDWEMPILNGLDVARMVRRPGSSANAYVPIIMISAYAEEHRVMAARDAGVNDYLTKPISAKSLCERVHNVIAYPRPFVRTASYFGPDRRRGVGNSHFGRERRSASSEKRPATSEGSAPATRKV